MSQALTVDVLRRELAALTTVLKKEIRLATQPHFRALNDDLLRIEGKVDTALTLLQHGARLDEMERRMITLAERTGNADLAMPIMRSVTA